MARKQSVILTPTQKKEIQSSAKTALKTQRTQHAELSLTIKRLTKAFEAANKERTKAFEAELKTLNKELARVNKEIAAAEATLSDLAPAVPSPTE